MKKTIQTLTVFVLAIVLATGCATNQSGSPSAIASQVLTPANLQSAAEFGTIADLQSRPQDAGYFQAAEDVLSSISTGTNTVSYADVQTGLAAAGTTNALASAAIAAFLPQIEQYALQNAPTNATAGQTSQQIKVGAGAVATGIGQGLKATGH